MRTDITKLRVECIVNAANEAGLGCFTPNHPCIDNAIHKAAGPGLLAECTRLPEVRKGVRVPTGTARITLGHKLPCRYVIHATGPSLRSAAARPDYRTLAQTYVACLDLAKLNGIHEIAFCCISTGIFGYDKREAAATAIGTVGTWLQQVHDRKAWRVIFVTFTDEDEAIYTTKLADLLRANR